MQNTPILLTMPIDISVVVLAPHRQVNVQTDFYTDLRLKALKETCWQEKLNDVTAFCLSLCSFNG